MEQLIQQNAQGKNLNTIFGVKNTFLDSENRKELEKDKKKREDKIITDVKKYFQTKKRNGTNQRYKKSFQTKKIK